MARAQADINSPYTFVKGLVTEANKLSEDLNLMTDGKNIDIKRNGSCERRKGLDIESAGYAQLTSSFRTSSSEAMKSVVWKNVNGNPAKSFLLCQTGNQITIYDLSFSPIVDGFVGGFNLSSYSINSTASANEPIGITAVTKYAILVNKYCEPLFLFFDEETEDLTIGTLILKIRDFAGLPDGLKIDERPTTLSLSHRYNLLNQGWSDNQTVVDIDLTGNGTIDGGNGSSGGGTTSDNGDTKITVEVV